MQYIICNIEMQLYVDFEQLLYLFLLKCMYDLYIRAQRNY